jgi:hypothetical protein
MDTEVRDFPLGIMRRRLHMSNVPSLYPFPTRRVGGLFLQVMGVTIIVATLLGGDQLLHPGVFFPGMIASIAGVLLNRRLRNRLAYGELSLRQRRLMLAALGLEAIGFPVLWFAYWGHDMHLYWLLALLLVGLHFLPFGLVHGPEMALLGVLCMLNAAAGLLIGGIPFVVTGLVDGLLKLILGTRMFLTRPPAESATQA